MLILDILVSPPWRCRPRWIYRLLCHPWRRKMSRQIENPFSDLYLPLQETWQRVSWLEQMYQQWDRFGSPWQECRCLAIMIGDERLAECISSCHFLQSIFSTSDSFESLLKFWPSWGFFWKQLTLVWAITAFTIPVSLHMKVYKLSKCRFPSATGNENLHRHVYKLYTSPLIPLKWTAVWPLFSV